MKYDLLQLTQRILSSIKGEEIADIADTAESLTVVDIIKECYFNIIANQDFPEVKTLYNLTKGSTTLKVFFTIPTSSHAMEWVKYNKRSVTDTVDLFEDVSYMPLKDFLDMTQQFSGLGATIVGSGSYTLPNSSSTTFWWRKDKAPTYFTVLQDDIVVFDSFDSAVETADGLASSKTLAYGIAPNAWSDTNTFVPQLDDQQVNVLLKEAKAIAWEELRQMPNQTAAMQARKAKISAEKKKDRGNYNHVGYYYEKYPNYGRK
jgi:hypothetical protein